MNDLSDIDPAGLQRLVHGFYARIRRDPVLGGIFEQAIDDWPAHLDRLTDFWTSVMLTSGRYKGNPIAAHRRHAGQITPELFDRWLALWAETCAELMLPAAAAALRAKAERIAESLKLALYFRLEPRPVAA